MARLPLLLDGAAFVVVDQMSDDDRKDPKKVKAALETPFAPSAAEAYHLFVGRRLALEEDIFVPDLQRLLKLSKHTLAADGKDPVLIEQFLSGLQAEFIRTLRLEHEAKSHTLPELVTKARGHAGEWCSSAGCSSGYCRSYAAHAVFRLWPSGPYET